MEKLLVVNEITFMICDAINSCLLIKTKILQICIHLQFLTVNEENKQRFKKLKILRNLILALLGYKSRIPRTLMTELRKFGWMMFATQLRQNSWKNSLE